MVVAEVLDVVQDAHMVEDVEPQEAVAHQDPLLIDNNTNSETKKLEFAPHSVGKPQKIACDSMKDHVVLLTQKTYRNGNDAAEALRTGNDAVPGSKPRRRAVQHAADNAKTEEDKANLQVMQQGFDLEHKEELRLCNARKEQCEDNKVKAYALMFSCCNKTMQNRIEEMSTFESEIRNKPIKLMDAIKEKMCDPARAKCEHVSLTETVARAILGTKQDFDEDSIEHTKRFKQAKDTFKQSVGAKTLDEFVVHAQEHKDAGSDAAAQKVVKEEAFNRWMTCLHVKNADPTRFGSLLIKFQGEHSLGNNQYPSTVSKAADALTNHRWDKEHGQKAKDRAKQRKESKAKQEEDSSKGSQQQNDTKSGSQFKQEWTELTCCCCGKKGHVAPDCPDKNKIPRSEWKAAKGMQMFVDQEENTDQEQSTDDEDDKSNNNKEPEKKQEKTKAKKKGWNCLQMDSMPMQRCYKQDEEEMEATDMKQAVVLDTGSTFASVANEELLTGVCNSDDLMQMNANVGSRVVGKKGEMPGLKADPWFDPKSKVNVFGFAKSAEQYRMTCDTSKMNGFDVHAEHGTIKFMKDENGLCTCVFSDEHKKHAEEEKEEDEERRTTCNDTRREDVVLCSKTS